MKQFFWMLILLAGVTSISEARAAALATLDQSVSAAGVANAFVATADDPSAVHYNPAGIAWQPGIGVMFSGALRFEDQSAQLSSGSGTPSNTESPVNLGSIYTAWMPRDGNWGMGFGFDLPFSVNTGWGTAFNGKAQRTSLDAFHLSLDAVYAISSSMAVAFGPDWYVGRIDVDSGTTTFHGTGATAVGGHVAWMWHPRPAWSVGAVFRSGATLNLSGDGIGAVSGAAETNVSLPDVMQFGIAHDFYDRFKLELNGSWTRWSTFDDLDVVSTGTAGTELHPFNLRDSLSAMVGLTWFWQEHTQFRFGYAFDEAATKNTGFNARISDANSHRLSIGMGVDAFGVHVDTVYSYVYSPARTISGSGVFNGRYKQRLQSLSLGVTKYF